MLSIVSPVYKAEKILSELVARIYSTVSQLNIEFEIILVCDGSPDDSWKLMQTLQTQYPRMKNILLSRNFGQHYAITAGLTEVKGDFCVVMDCDLQDRPEEIQALWSRLHETKSDAVVARRIERHDNWFKTTTSKGFYSTLNWLSGIGIDPTVANFGIYSKQFISAVLSMGDAVRYFPAQAKWVGFDVQYMNVEHAARQEGTSSYNWKSLSKLAIDIILTYSDKPLKLTVGFGFLISALTICVAIFYLIQGLFHSFSVEGFPSIMVSIWFLGGVLISIMGMVGLYIGKIFQVTKRRQVFIIKYIQ